MKSEEIKAARSYVEIYEILEDSALRSIKVFGFASAGCLLVGVFLGVLGLIRDLPDMVSMATGFVSASMIMSVTLLSDVRNYRKFSRKRLMWRTVLDGQK